MKKKVVLLFAASALVTSMLSACGNSSNAAQSSTTPASSSSSASSSTSSTSKATTTSTTPTTSKTAAGKTETINVKAKDFEFDQKEIHVKKGDKVKLTLTSDDGGHGLSIPAYNVDIKGNGSAQFTADKAGTFEYHCSVMCGAGHSKMTGKLIVQ
jgi:cytochrome c oxidase subunit II